MLGEDMKSALHHDQPAQQLSQAAPQMQVGTLQS